MCTHAPGAVLVKCPILMCLCRRSRVNDLHSIVSSQGATFDRGFVWFPDYGEYAWKAARCMPVGKDVIVSARDWAQGFRLVLHNHDLEPFPRSCCYQSIHAVLHSAEISYTGEN